MDIIDLLVGFGFLIVALLTFYLLKNDLSDYSDPAKDPTGSSRVLNLNRKVKHWLIIIICIMCSVASFIKAF